MQDEEFKGAAWAFVTYMISYVVAFLTTALIIRSKNNMDFWQTIIAAVITSVIAGIATFLATSYIQGVRSYRKIQKP